MTMIVTYSDNLHTVRVDKNLPLLHMLYDYTPQRDMKQRELDMEQLQQQYNNVWTMISKLLHIDPTPCMWSLVYI